MLPLTGPRSGHLLWSSSEAQANQAGMPWSTLSASPLPSPRPPPLSAHHAAHRAQSKGMRCKMARPQTELMEHSSVAPACHTTTVLFSVGSITSPSETISNEDVASRCAQMLGCRTYGLYDVAPAHSSSLNGDVPSLHLGLTKCCPPHWLQASFRLAPHMPQIQA